MGTRARAAVVGFGVTGAGAARQLLRSGTPATDLVAVDVRPEAAGAAADLGIPMICGDATTRDTLARAVSDHTRCVIVTAGPDAVAVMVTMLARDLGPEARVVTAVREAALVPFARRAGADEVHATSHWTGRILARLLDPAALDDRSRSRETIEPQGAGSHGCRSCGRESMPNSVCCPSR